jgi:hypothetical protein
MRWRPLTFRRQALPGDRPPLHAPVADGSIEVSGAGPGPAQARSPAARFPCSSALAVRSAHGLIEIDGVELVAFAAITDAEVRRPGESDRETLRERAAHARPIDEPTSSTGSSRTR